MILVKLSLSLAKSRHGIGQIVIISGQEPSWYWTCHYLKAKSRRGIGPVIISKPRAIVGYYPDSLILKDNASHELSWDLVRIP